MVALPATVPDQMHPERTTALTPGAMSLEEKTAVAPETPYPEGTAASTPGTPVPEEITAYACDFPLSQPLVQVKQGVVY